MQLIVEVEGCQSVPRTAHPGTKRPASPAAVRVHSCSAWCGPDGRDGHGRLRSGLLPGTGDPPGVGQREEGGGPAADRLLRVAGRWGEGPAGGRRVLDRTKLILAHEPSQAGCGNPEPEADYA